MLDSIDAAPGVDDETRHRVRFFAKQFCDAMSPTNFAFLNPAVIEETVRTQGQNLQRGAENLLQDMRENEGRPALVDKRAFEVGKNVATSKGAVVFRNELIELIQYEPSTPSVYTRPLLIVPPWINKFYILGAAAGFNSLVKCRRRQRHVDLRHLMAQPEREPSGHHDAGLLAPRSAHGRAHRLRDRRS